MPAQFPISTAAGFPIEVEGPDAEGIVPTHNPVLFAGTDPGSAVKILELAPDGTLLGYSATIAGADARNNIAVINTDSGGLPVEYWVRNYYYNGAAWDRTRGNVRGAFAQGDIARDAPIIVGGTANPQLNGGRGSTATPAAVSADGDMVDNWLDRKGRQVGGLIPGSDADIIGNSVAAAGLVITVPAGRTWIGTIHVAASIGNAAAGGAAESGSAWLEIAGAGALPAPGVRLAQVNVQAAQSSATGSGNNDSDVVSMSYVIIRAAAGVAATLTLTTAGTPDQVAASAVGQLL